MPAISRRLDDKNVDNPIIAKAVFAGRGEGAKYAGCAHLGQLPTRSAVVYWIGHAGRTYGLEPRALFQATCKPRSFLTCRSITNEGSSLRFKRPPRELRIFPGIRIAPVNKGISGQSAARTRNSCGVRGRGSCRCPGGCDKVPFWKLRIGHLAAGAVRDPVVRGGRFARR